MTHSRSHVRILAALFTIGSVVAPNRAFGQSPPPDLLVTHLLMEGIQGVVDETVQTPDGFLWLVEGSSKLFRYDGSSFQAIKKFSPVVRAIAGAPGGDLWVATDDGLTRVAAAKLTQLEFDGLTFHRPEGGAGSRFITCLRLTNNGVLWVGTRGGLFRYQADRFVAVGPPAAIREIETRPDGHLLVTTEAGFFEIAAEVVVPHPALPKRLGVGDRDIFQVLTDRLGHTWYVTAMGIARESNGRLETVGARRRSSDGVLVHEDPQGTVWVGKEGGLFRSTPTGLESVAPGLHIRSLYGDHDGNLWVGTNGDGLYRVRSRPIRMFTTADGLPNDVLMTVLASRDGTIWTGANCGGLTRFDGVRFQTLNEKDGLTNGCVWALAETSQGDLWIGTWGGGAFLYRDGKFTQYSTPQGMSNDVIYSIAAARDGTVWFATRIGLTRLSDGVLRNFTTADGLRSERAFRVREDRAGSIWVGTTAGLHRMVGDRAEFISDLPSAQVLPLGEDRDGALLVGHNVDQVLYRLQNGSVEAITKLPFVNEMAETRGGDLWFGGNALLRVPRESLTRTLARDEPLDRETFSVADGLGGTGTSVGHRSLAMSLDGESLWAATSKGLARVDLRRLPIIDTKPRLYLKSVTIGRDTGPAGRDIVLPPGTSHFEISFAAVEISAPEKIHLQYRLYGVDQEWLDAPADPRAIYSHIPVGANAFRIRASNRNGIWDREGVVFQITQQPHFYQTGWFAAAMIALVALLVGGTYRLRVRQISRGMAVRFDERLAERTRVAREIHDTFLQTVQGSKMVADHALKDSADHARMVRAMEQLSGWLGQATEEGRAALNSLRASTTETNDLAAALRRAIDECSPGSGLDTALTVTGEAREMHPLVRDEVYRIGYEAIRNACAHSSARRIEVALDYGRDLTVRVSDNGVGMDTNLVEHGRDGHFGMRGMHERADRIGGLFTVVSAPGSGTVITLVVPGGSAFAGGGGERSHALPS